MSMTELCNGVALYFDRSFARDNAVDVLLEEACRVAALRSRLFELIFSRT